MGNAQQKLEVNLANLDQTEENDSERSTTFTCEICIEPLSSMKQFKNNDRCVHPFCIDCLAKHIQAKLEENVANIKCPALDCEEVLDPLACRAIVPVETFTKWCDILCDSSLLVFERCYCPYQNCSALIINECGRAVKKTKCPDCRRFFCYTCKVPWHAGYWCNEARYIREANDVNFGELMEKFNWTRCPHCGQVVERIGGCRFVSCRCGNTFCHKCGKEYHYGKCDGPQGCSCELFCQLLLNFTLIWVVGCLIYSPLWIFICLS